MNIPNGKLTVPKWFIDLKGELHDLTDEQQKAESLARLEEAYKNYSGEDRVISSLDLAEEIKSRPPIPKIMTGITKLDDILGGFVSKQLIVIAAPTKSGKTSFCIELTIRLKEYNPLWLPFEEPAEELILKFLERKENPPLFYTPIKLPTSTLEWVEKKIIEAKIKYNSKIVFIDHLHFIVPFSAERNDLMIGQTMRELKKLAKQWDVVIFIISHLKKTKMIMQPDLEDLRDSSFTAQEADTVIMLWRKNSKEDGQVVITNEVNVSIQANRRTGKTGNISMVYTDGRFMEKSLAEDKELDQYARQGWN